MAICLLLTTGPTEAVEAAWCLLSGSLCAAGLLTKVDFKATLGCLSTAGTCTGGALARPLEIPDCVFKLKPCLDFGFGVGGAAGNGAALQSLSVRKQAIGEIPSEVRPLLRQVD